MGQEEREKKIDAKLSVGVLASSYLLVPVTTEIEYYHQYQKTDEKYLSSTSQQIVIGQVQQVIVTHNSHKNILKPLSQN